MQLYQLATQTVPYNYLAFFLAVVGLAYVLYRAFSKKDSETIEYATTIKAFIPTAFTIFLLLLNTEMFTAIFGPVGMYLALFISAVFLPAMVGITLALAFTHAISWFAPQYLR